MKNVWVGLLVLLSSIGAVAARQAPGAAVQSAQGFNFVLRYGVEMAHPNILDTASGKFTKDTVSSASTTDLRLTDSEMAQVRKKLEEIDFWSLRKYPAGFVSRDCGMDPNHSMALKVTEGSSSRDLAWTDMGSDTLCSHSNGPAEELRTLLRMIRGMIESKPEYQRLPPARGYK